MADIARPDGVIKIDLHKGRTGILYMSGGHVGEPVDVCLVEGAINFFEPQPNDPPNEKRQTENKRYEEQEVFRTSGPLPVCTRGACKECFVPLFVAMRRYPRG